MSEKFRPEYLSTTEIITDISGRGVGMDVVKKTIEGELRGEIGVSTRKGRGTTFELRLPLSLAVIRVLIVSAGERRYALDNHAVFEIVEVQGRDIIPVAGMNAIRLRDEFVSIARLTELIGISSGMTVPKPASRVTAIVIKSETEKIAVIVDELIDEIDTVLKPLPKIAAGNRLAAGLTTTGRNEIIPILLATSLVSAMKVARRNTTGSGFEATETANKTAVRILIVDDSVNTREIEKSVLESWGYLVDTAVDGVEGFELGSGGGYDLIVTDVEMPRLDGFSLTKKLRANESTRDTPIVIVTSREKEEDRRRGIAVGANAYISKGSFDQSNLAETVKNLIG